MSCGRANGIEFDASKESVTVLPHRPPSGGSVKLGTSVRVNGMQAAAFSTGSIWANVDMAPADPILGLND